MLPETLLALQRDFRDALLGDAAVPGHLFSAPAEAGFAVYRNTVQASLVEVLAAAFPVVRRIVGAGFFDALALRFVAAEPPREPRLLLYGAAFPAFIAADPATSTLPYLSDVARLEWARAEAYFAADAPVLDPKRLAAVPPAAIGATRLALHPAVRLVVAPYPIHRIWRVNQPEVADVPAVDMTIAEAVLVSRPAHAVILRPIGAGDAAFIAAITAGASLEEAADEAVTRDAAFDLEGALRDHLINGSFASIVGA